MTRDELLTLCDQYVQDGEQAASAGNRAGVPDPTDTIIHCFRDAEISAAEMQSLLAYVCQFERDDQWAEADGFRKAYMSLLPLLHYTYSAINPVAVKSLMKAVGLPAGNLRKPLMNLEGEALMKGVRIVQQLGLDKQYGWKLKPASAIAAE